MSDDPQTTRPVGRTRADFDRLAAFASDGWDHNSHYHPFLLRHLPPRLGAALEVGCGAGTFARLLARRADRVLGMDLSPEMIRIARERSAACPNLEYRAADVMECELPPGHFDCVASLATLHHLPLAAALAKLAATLRPGGTLLLLDLYRPETLADALVGALALPASLLLRAVRRGRLRPPREEREAWTAHGREDVYPTLAEVREASAALLPGARVRRHLLWRYSLVWSKPEDGSLRPSWPR